MIQLVLHQTVNDYFLNKKCDLIVSCVCSFHTAMRVIESVQEIGAFRNSLCGQLYGIYVGKSMRLMWINVSIGGTHRHRFHTVGHKGNS